jgi:hypothetical protein
MRNQRSLNLPYGGPINRGSYELRAEQIEVFQTLRAVDEIRIGNRIGRAGEKIRQTHLVPHAQRQYIQSEIKRAGNLLENVVKEFVCYGISTQGENSKVNSKQKQRTLHVGERKGQGSGNLHGLSPYNTGISFD